MMHQIQVFGFEGINVRTVDADDQVWFAAPDVAKALGLTNTTVAVNGLDSDERTKFSLGRQGETNFISEPGLYRLIGASRKSAAKRFNRWVTHEVLPTIRKHGAYMTPDTIKQVLLNPDTVIELATQLKAEQAKTARLSEDNRVMQPKALFADAVSTSHTSILVGDLAKLIKQNGVDIGGQRLFAWLRTNGYLIKRQGTDFNSPTQRAMNLGLFEVKETAITHSDGHVTVNKTPKVTGKGQQYFVNKFLGSQEA